MFVVILVLGIIVLIIAIILLFKEKKKMNIILLENSILSQLGYNDWNIIPIIDCEINVLSHQTLDKYDDIRFFRDKNLGITVLDALNALKRKEETASYLISFLNNNIYKSNKYYSLVEKNITNQLCYANSFNISVSYISSANNLIGAKTISLNRARLEYLNNNPTLLMNKTEYNQFVKQQDRDILEARKKVFYDRINNIIDNVNYNKNNIIIKKRIEELDNLVWDLFEKTVNSIQKVKSSSSEEWNIISNVIGTIENDIYSILNENNELLNYYNSYEFNTIKQTCNNLMSTQREFNEYIANKAASISELFGKNIIRNETVNNDEYNYIRPYKKTITPFTVEVSKQVFSSAENNPLEYIVKQFYPNKELYPQQINKLHLLVEELESLKEAKIIIDNYKREYQQYLTNVPAFVIEKDESGFYSRLGFANIDESVLTVEYKFSYTSDGGFARRSFSVPMTEETIVELIAKLESKLTLAAFSKEQRSLMTARLRQHIKERDNFTCRICGNSISREPNLLLEIDHIIPVSRGGVTEENNLQTLCWKCNRSKGNKL